MNKNRKIKNLRKKLEETIKISSNPLPMFFEEDIDAFKRERNKLFKKIQKLTNNKQGCYYLM